VLFCLHCVDDVARVCRGLRARLREDIGRPHRGLFRHMHRILGLHDRIHGRVRLVTHDSTAETIEEL